MEVLTGRAEASALCRRLRGRTGSEHPSLGGLVRGGQLLAGAGGVGIGAGEAEMDLAELVDHRRDELRAAVAEQLGADA